MANLSVEKFVELLKRSKLIEHIDQLAKELAEIKVQLGGKYPKDSRKLADHLVEREVITAWQAEKILEGRHKGFFLGKYKLLGHIGSGGMSTVYRAAHVLMYRQAAIKVLPRTRVEDSSYLARFYLEAQAAARLDDRNIVRIYDVDSEGDIHYIVMEFVDGPDLQRLVKQEGPLEYDTAANYIAQGAIGLEHAHQAGLIHRDVKPANFLVDAKGVVKVLDMGLARFVDEDKSSLTVAHDENVLGTADYLAPEQAVDSHSVDERADIYGLGCTLYFLLTGHPPFPTGTLPQRLMMHQTKAPARIEVDRPDIPKKLAAICERMMAKSPDARPQSAAEVASLLIDWLASRGQTFDDSSGSSPRLGGDSSAKLKSIGSDVRRTGGPTKKAARHRKKPQRPRTAVGPKTAISIDERLANVESAKEGRSQRGDRKSTGSKSRERLPVAKALPGSEPPDPPESETPSEFQFKGGGKSGGKTGGKSSSKSGGKSSGASRPSSMAAKRAARRRSSKPPAWMWFVVLGAAAAVIALAVVLVQGSG